MVMIRKNTSFTFLIAFLLLLFNMSVAKGQSECYVEKWDLQGMDIARDSLLIRACNLRNYMPATTIHEFMVISHVNYSLDSYFDKTERKRYIDSLKKENLVEYEFYLGFYWSYEKSSGEKNLDIEFIFPNDKKYDNCFTDPKINFIEADLQRIGDSILSENDFSLGEILVLTEIEVLRKVENAISEIYNCCANRSSDCSLCLTDEQLDIIKEHAGVGELPTSTAVTNSQTIIGSGFFSEELRGFKDFVGEDIIFGQTIINIKELYEDYTELDDVSSDYNVFFVKDSYFCLESFPSDDEEFSMLIASFAGGEIQFQCVHSKLSEKISFVEFIVKRYPDIFGRLIESVSLKDSELYPVEDGNVESFFTGTGAILLRRPYAEASFAINDVYLAMPDEDEIMTGTLHAFSYRNVRYSAVKEKYTNHYLGFYPSIYLQYSKNGKRVLTSLATDLVDSRFTDIHPEHISYSYVNSNVIALSNETSGVVPYIWKDVSDISSTFGEEKIIFIPAFAKGELDQEDYFWFHTDVDAPNIIIFITDTNESPYSKPDILTNNDNWNMACVPNLYNAKVAIEEIYSKHGVSRLENVIVRQHGSSTHFSATAANGGQLKGAEIRKYLGQEGTYYSDTDKKNIEAFVYIMEQLNYQDNPGSLYFYGCNLGNTLAIDNCETNAICQELFQNSFLYAFSSLMVAKNIRYASFFMNTDATGIHKDGNKQFVLMGWGLESTDPELKPSYWKKGTYGEVQEINTDFIIYKSGNNEPIERNN